jgi:hypothetical protein
MGVKLGLLKKRIFGPMREEATRYYYGDKIDEDGMGGACSRHSRKEAYFNP